MSVQRNDPYTLFICGASARAAAMSAHRAGYRVITSDLFGDLDLQSLGPTFSVCEYPHGFIGIAEQVQADAWLYCGGLENHAEVVAEISRNFPLAGTKADVLPALRDPLHLARVFAQAGLPFPATQPVPPANRAGWLWKPARSSGGSGIVAASEFHPSASTRRTGFWQRLLVGIPVGATFLFQGQSAQLVGVAQQLVGREWTGTHGFRYAGSIAVPEWPAPLYPQWQRIADCLAQAFTLQGLVNVDAMQVEETIWVLEVNPRYSASMELWERTYHVSMIARHLEACGASPPSLPPFTLGGSSVYHGKAICFAPRPISITESFVAQLRRHNVSRADGSIPLNGPTYADIPRPGTAIRAGGPIATVFAAGTSLDQTESRLREAADRIWKGIDA